MGCLGGGAVPTIEGIDEILNDVTQKIMDIKNNFTNDKLLEEKKQILEKRHAKLKEADKSKEEELTKLIKELNGKDLEIDNKLIQHELNKMQKIYEIGLEYADILKDKLLKQLEKKADSAIVKRQIEQIRKFTPSEFLNSPFGKPLKDLLAKQGLSNTVLKGYIEELTQERAKRRKEEREEFGIKVNEYPDEELYDALKKDLFQEMMEETGKNYVSKLIGQS